MDTRERLLRIIRTLEPDLQELVAEVIELEREHLDLQRPHGVKERIRDIIERYARAPAARSEEGR